MSDNDYILKAVTGTLKFEARGHELEAAKQLKNYAGLKLEMASIKHRAQELQTQFEPIASWANGNYSPRELADLVSTYILTGKRPPQSSKEA